MPQPDKIVPIGELAGIFDRYREESKTIVHCHGVFDLVHIGHIRYLQKARRLGDVLAVTITPDELVNKGPHRPVFEQSLRAEALAALDCVDHVSVNEWPTACDTLKLLKPHVYVKGAEFRNKKTPELLEEERIAQSVGTRVEFIEELTSSSSFLINNYLSPFAEEADQYLFKFRQTQTPEEILARLEKARDLKILVVGEAILDEYYACATLGQSVKSTSVVGRYLSHQRHLAGAPAVANHLAAFSDQVTLITMLGTEKTHEEWIRSQLHDNVNPQFFRRRRAPTIVKRQYQESYFGTTFFEVDYLNQEPLAKDESAVLDDLIRQTLGDCDLVVVADYGHAMLDAERVQSLVDGAAFLAVATQANAANVGYHPISKYPRADHFILSEHELRLECRGPAGDLRPMLENTVANLNARTAVVTSGSRGCLCADSQGHRCEAPALATRVVDRSGAGEACLAVTALAAVLEAPLAHMAFLCNVAGAEAVAVPGNSAFLERLSFQRHVESLFK
jgi:rfaE bifunctional protein nucleotidyltransferase chain/domain